MRAPAEPIRQYGRSGCEGCGKTVTKASQRLLSALEKTLGGCAQKVFTCVQSKPDALECIAKATKGCDKGAAKVDAALGKFQGAIAKRCGTVDIGVLRDATGLNLHAQGTRCASADGTVGAYADCLAEQVQCASAGLVRGRIARAEQFDATALGGLAATIAARCPEAPGTTAAATSRATAVALGSIVKFVKSAGRPKVPGQLVVGKLPTPSGAGRGVFVSQPLPPLKLGPTVKIPFSYRVGFGHKSRADAAVPQLVVTVRRDDGVFDDHFEIPLVLPAGDAEVSDTLEVVYDQRVGCAATLELAIRVGSAVSAYTPVVQILDAAVPPPLPPGTILEIADESGDGVHQLQRPIGMALDGAGNVYVAGEVSHNAFRITPQGTITQIIDAAGDGVHALNQPQDIAVDPAGNVYVVAAISRNAFKITPDGTITQIIDATGVSGPQGSILNGSKNIAVDALGNVYVTGSNVGRVFKIDPNGVKSVVATSDGDGVNQLDFPMDIAIDGDRNVYVNGYRSNNVFRISPDGATIEQLIDAAGAGPGSGLSLVHGVAVDANKNVYVSADGTNNVLKRTAAGVISKILDATGDGLHTLENPVRIAIDSGGAVFVSGQISANVFRIAPGGGKTRILDSAGAGPGKTLFQPYDVAVDADDNIYVVGHRSHNVFKIIAPAD